MIMENLVVGVDAIIEKDNKILILQRSKKDKSYPEYWSLPGGKINFGEDLIDALKREVREESNLDVDILLPIDAHGKVMEDGKHIVVITFLCSYKSGEVKLSKEHDTFKWLEPKKVTEIEELSPFLEHSIYSYLDFISA
jgi:8-oxo-dGTP diphosphatase